MCKLQLLFLTNLCWNMIKGDMDQQNCNKLDPMSNNFGIITRYAPSLITCSFICRDTPGCKTYSYSSGQCSLYWTSALWSPTSKGLLTCTSAKVCQKTINNGEFSCSMFHEQNTCYCTSPNLMLRGAAVDSCSKYGMKLISVQTREENTFIRDTIKAIPVTEFCVWTSALRTGPSTFIWNSTGQTVNIDINRSSYVDGVGGDCLIYLRDALEQPWLWDDWRCYATCINMCEYTP